MRLATSCFTFYHCNKKIVVLVLVVLRILDFLLVFIIIVRIMHEMYTVKFSNLSVYLNTYETAVRNRRVCYRLGNTCRSAVSGCKA